MGSKGSKSRTPSDLLETVDITNTEVFGKQLSVVMERSETKSEYGDVPNILFQCVRFLNQSGINEEGIHRISGNKRIVNELKQKFNEGKNVDFLYFIESGKEFYSVHDVASLMTDFWHEAPLPKWSDRINDDISLRSFGLYYSKNKPDESNMSDEEKKQTKTDLLIKFIKTTLNDPEFPPYYRNCLQCISHHMMLVCRNSEVNKMHPDNLLMCFRGQKHLQDLYRELIQHYEAIFN
ncbi:RhoGAP [Acrasis kona]|uniref:RhoGAP n=1 Tax=Acrasis kona TaxID=1008807 RepID=A0AAW2Z1A8_9EUKA